MAILRVIRQSGRITYANLGNDMRAIWEDEDINCRMAKGVANYSWNDIVNSFLFVQNTYRTYGVQYHTFQLEIREEIEQENVIELMVNILEYFGREFQILTTYKMNSGRHFITVILNATSYINGKKFEDNNAQYYELANFIKAVEPEIKVVNFEMGTLYNNSEGDSCCYV